MEVITRMLVELKAFQRFLEENVHQKVSHQFFHVLSAELMRGSFTVWLCFDLENVLLIVKFPVLQMVGAALAFQCLRPLEKYGSPNIHIS